MHHVCCGVALSRDPGVLQTLAGTQALRRIELQHSLEQILRLVGYLLEGRSVCGRGKGFMHVHEHTYVGVYGTFVYVTLCVRYLFMISIIHTYCNRGNVMSAMSVLHSLVFFIQRKYNIYT